MLKLAFCILLVGVFKTNANFFGDLEALPDDPFTHNSWNWRSQYHWPENRRSDETSDSAEKREPLSPEYKDPLGKPSENKPTVVRGPSFNSEVLPGGVVDVDAGDGGMGYPQVDFPNFPEFQNNFGFGVAGGDRKPGSGLFGLGGFFGNVGEYKPWWKGDNVCIEREESTDDEEETIEAKKNETEVDRVPNFFATSISLSNCHQTPSKYECITKINNHGVVKTFTVRYKCCYGFERMEGSTGCNKKLELKSVAQTLEGLEGKEFMSLIKITGFETKLDQDNYTVFLPTDQALLEFDDKMNDMNRVEMVRRRREAVTTEELVQNHLVKGFIDLNDYSNEELINTENNNKSIRINIYPTRGFEKMLTANCVRVKKMNNLAENGIIHVIDGVIKPAAQTIQEIISENRDLSSLKTVMENTELFTLFKNDGHYTMFAPTNQAFDKLDEIARKKLLNGNACASSILKHHIMSNTICSAAIMGNATTHNMVGEIVNMERTDEDKLIIEGKAVITKTDIIASNGVIHLLDTIIIPDTALYLNDALKKNNITKFQELIKSAEFEEELDGFENATIFAPRNEALETPEAKEYLDAIKEDKEKLRQFIRHHTVQGELETCNMENNALLNSTEENQKLRVNLYSTLPLFANIVNRATVNCARLTNFDEKSCGSIIHEIDRILTPVDQTIMDIINADEKFSTLKKIMKDTEIEKILSDEKQAITFAAPDDEAFKNIDEADMKTLMEDKEKAVAVLKNHILSEVLCCSGVGPQTFGFNSVVPTLSGQHQQVSRNGNHQVRIGRSSVLKCDKVATNGVVHTINRVLFPQRPHQPHFGFFLFDL